MWRRNQSNTGWALASTPQCGAATKLILGGPSPRHHNVAPQPKKYWVGPRFNTTMWRRNQTNTGWAVASTTQCGAATKLILGGPSLQHHNVAAQPKKYWVDPRFNTTVWLRNQSNTGWALASTPQCGSATKVILGGSSLQHHNVAPQPK